MPAPAQGGDPAVWTVLGEAGTDPQGQLAVGSTLYNRRQASGAKTFGEVATDPANGYEAWQDANARANTQKLYPVGSPAYQSAQQTLAALDSGQVKPLPYDSFYSPKAQAALGRKPPAFENGSGVDIGGNRFFSGAYKPPSAPDLTAILGAPELKDQAGGAAQPTPDQQVTVGPQHIPPSAAQNATILARQKAGLIDTTQPQGSDANPYAEKLRKDGTAEPLPAGAYVDLQGGFHPGPRSAVQLVQNALSGLGQSAVDTAASGARFGLGGGDPLAAAVSQVQGGPSAFAMRQAALQGFGQGQQRYALEHAGQPEAQFGRFVGQAIPATVAAAAVPEIEAPNALGAIGRAGAGALSNALRGTAAAATNVGANPNQSVASQLGSGAVAGVAVPAALGGVGKVGSALRGIAQGIVEPLTETGRGNIADRLIAARAAGSNITNPDLTEYVPGSVPTTAEALGNTGLAIAQRSITNDQRFTELGRANAAARDAVVSALKGDPAQREALVADREAQTAPLLQQAFANPKPTDPSPVVQTIDQILASKAGQRDAVRQPLQEVRDKLVNPDGSMQTDPEQLWGVRQDIDDRLSPLARGTARSAQAAAAQLMQVKQALDPVIDQGAPGFSKYVQNFADLSRPINEHDFLQGLNLTTPTHQVTAGQVGNALKTIARMQAAGGVNGAKALSPDTIQTLQNLQSDLARQANNQLGRGQGSDTVQKAVENMASGTAGLHPLLQVAGIHMNPTLGAVAALGNGFYMGQRTKILNAYADRLLNPELGMAALQPRSPGAVGGALRGVGATAKKVQIPLSALMGVRLANPVGANAQ